MRRIAVLTTFVHVRAAYSLCNVVEAHVRMLLRNGYETTFVACDGFRPEGVYCNRSLRHWRMPAYLIDTDSEAVDRSTDYQAGVERIVAALRPLMPRIDVAITHDLAYLPNYLAYNQACRQLASEFPHVTWLHFLHSAPWPNPGLPESDPRSARFKPFDRSFLLYPNPQDIPRVSAQYAVDKSAVKVVPHPIDWENTFDFHPLTRALIQQFDLYAPDVFAIYPIRMDRGKQPEKVVRLFAALKAAGASVRLVIINSHSNRQHFIDYRDDIISEVEPLGLTSREVIFTNQIETLPGVSPRLLDSYRFEVPHRVVLDLFRLTNIYVHPSTAESYSLVSQEAAASGNLLFLNEDVPAMRTIYGNAARYLKFSSSRSSTVSRADEAEYYTGAAQDVLGSLRTEATVYQRTRLRQTRHPQAVFHDWLEPLLYMLPPS